MKIKKRPIVFHNVLSLTDFSTPNEWYSLAIELRNFVIQQGYYSNSPFFYQVKKVGEGDEEKLEYTVSLALNREVKLRDDAPLTFTSEIKIDQALVFRMADLDSSMEESYAILMACANSNGYKLKAPFYHVFLNVFDEGMFDIIAPISEDKSNV